MRSPARLFSSIALIGSLGACGGGGGSDAPATYSVSVSVSGLTGSGLVLQNNGADNLAVSTNGTATFATRVADGGRYQVAVLTGPTSPSQTCFVSGGSGTVSGASPAPIAVSCCRRLIGYAGGATPPGLYEVDTSTGTAKFVTSVQSFLGTGGLAKFGADWYATNYTSSPGAIPANTYGKLNLATGAFTPVGTQTSQNWVGLAEDPQQGVLYVMDNDTRTLLRFTPGAAATMVGVMTTGTVQPDLRGMAYDQLNGRFFAAEYYQGSPSLYLVNKNTGALTLVGSLGFASASAGGDVPIAYDEANQTLYASESVTRSLYTVNTATGLATKVGTHGVPLGSLALNPDTSCSP